MTASPTIQRAHRVYDLLQPRCERLGLCVWLCRDSGEAVRRPGAPSGKDTSLVVEMERLLPGVASSVLAEPRTEAIGLPGGRWAVALPLGRHGGEAGLIIAATAEPLEESAFSDLARITRWMFADICKSVKDDETLGQFGDKLAQAYEETNLLFRLARLLNVVKEPDKLLEMVCGQLREVLPFGWLGVKFSRSDQVPQLQGRLIAAGTLPCDPARFAAAADSLLANYKSDDWTRLLSVEASELAQLAGGDVLAEPITHDGLVIGALLAGGKQGEDKDFVSGEMHFIDAAADFLGVFHQNVARFTEQRAMFMGTLKALTASIDAKDPYTRGHSERVALLARQLARAIGIGEQEAETYSVAGLVHDIGKIGVPEAVLCKMGKLNEAEFAQIKLHPVIGHGILKGIPAMETILAGILHHHERWDGRGYPDGLSGEAIPDIARTLALADSFDAMSSTRSYRPAMGREAVMAEIQRCSGCQFDPRLVAMFTQMDFTEFDAMLANAPATSRQEPSGDVGTRHTGRVKVA